MTEHGLFVAFVAALMLALIPAPLATAIVIVFEMVDSVDSVDSVDCGAVSRAPAAASAAPVELPV